MYVRTYVPDRMTEVLRFFFECQLYTVELPHDSLLFGGIRHQIHFDIPAPILSNIGLFGTIYIELENSFTLS